MEHPLECEDVGRLLRIGFRSGISWDICIENKNIIPMTTYPN